MTMEDIEAAVDQPEPCPIAIVDVHYRDSGVLAACVVAQQWNAPSSIEERVASLSSVQPYKPGSFFERELPCILDVLFLVRTQFRVVVVDGYVNLDETGSPGLGAHLHEHFDGAFPVVGIAKTPYRGGQFAAQVLRGSSRCPLFVTARGMPLAKAAHLVEAMHGVHRIPTLLKRTDHLARGLESATSSSQTTCA